MGRLQLGPPQQRRLRDEPDDREREGVRRRNLRGEGDVLLGVRLLDAADADLLLPGDRRLRVRGRDVQLPAERGLDRLHGDDVLQRHPRVVQ
jgi:hypothetical protein